MGLRRNFAGGALPKTNFSEGKTVTVLIGAKSGSLAIAAQIAAQHLGKYIPGKPTDSPVQAAPPTSLLPTTSSMSRSRMV